MHESQVRKVNLAEAFAGLHEHWSPRIAADVNEMQIKVVRIQGEFVWHHHELEDELFLVLSGTLHMRLRERTVTVAPGELIVIPAGVEHQPAAQEETQVLLFERAGTVNTGNVRDQHTVESPQRLVE